MKKSRFTDSQITDVLKLAEAGIAVPDLCREQGVSSSTHDKWRAKNGDMDGTVKDRMCGRDLLQPDSRCPYQI